MSEMRQDAWSKDEDIILAETVLNYIREGKTQLEAFKEVASRLSRTSAACGFRWNATVRKEYQEAIERAKEERKQGVNKDAQSFIPSEDSGKDTIESAILLLEKMKINFPDERDVLQGQTKALETLEKENEQLKEQLKRYDHAWEEMNKLWVWVKKQST